MKISFAGCGFLGVYHLAVTRCLRENAPWLLEDVEGLYGCSIGSVVAAALACEVNFMKEINNAVVELVEKAHASPLGALSSKCDVAAVVRRVVDRLLPKDAHRKVRGRLRISVTEFPSLQNRILDDFNTRNELITVRTCVCTCVVCMCVLMSLCNCSSIGYVSRCASLACVPCTQVSACTHAAHPFQSCAGNLRKLLHPSLLQLGPIHTTVQRKGIEHELMVTESLPACSVWMHPLVYDTWIVC